MGKRKKKAVRIDRPTGAGKDTLTMLPYLLLFSARGPPSASSGTLWCNHGRCKSRRDDSKKSGEQCRSNGMIPVPSGLSQSSRSHV